MWDCSSCYAAKSKPQKTRSPSAEKGTDFLGKRHALTTSQFSFLFALYTQLLVTMSQPYLTLGMGKASLGHNQKLPCLREVGTSTNHTFLRSHLLQMYLPGTYEGIVC